MEIKNNFVFIHVIHKQRRWYAVSQDCDSNKNIVHLLLLILPLFICLLPVNKHEKYNNRMETQEENHKENCPHNSERTAARRHSLLANILY